MHALNTDMHRSEHTRNTHKHTHIQSHLIIVDDEVTRISFNRISLTSKNCKQPQFPFTIHSFALVWFVISKQWVQCTVNVRRFFSIYIHTHTKTYTKLSTHSQHPFSFFYCFQSHINLTTVYWNWWNDLITHVVKMKNSTVQLNANKLSTIIWWHNMGMIEIIHSFDFVLDWEMDKVIIFIRCNSWNNKFCSLALCIKRKMKHSNQLNSMTHTKTFPKFDGWLSWAEFSVYTPYIIRFGAEKCTISIGN